MFNVYRVAFRAFTGSSDIIAQKNWEQEKASCNELRSTA